MRDSRLTKSERTRQRSFSIAVHAGALLIGVAVLLAARLLIWMPDREALGPSRITLRFTSVSLDQAEFGRLRLAGAWRVESADRRFGGISALAMDDGGLLALTDRGLAIRFAMPRQAAGEAEIHHLPAGPGKPWFNRDRDTEGLVRDPARRGWWVSFENHDQLWLYDPGFSRALARIRLPRDWPSNEGVEAAALGPSGELLLFPEHRAPAVRIRGGRRTRFNVEGRGTFSEAANDVDGSLLLIERALTLLGFSNVLVRLVPEGGGFRVLERIDLPLGPLANVEALAVQPLGAGRRRLWLMTDDNFQPPMRTLLVALDLPSSAVPSQPAAR